jgi:hypothetical protein
MAFSWVHLLVHVYFVGRFFFSETIALAGNCFQLKIFHQAKSLDIRTHM